MIKCLSFEFLLDSRPNGGTVILARSIGVSLEIYVLALILKELLSASIPLQFDWSELRCAIVDTIPWFGAIFAGVYVAFYSRFSSQWSYLADLYNQIMATAAQCDNASSHSNKMLKLWKAGFIEDADELHLAEKPMFASVIKSMLDDKEVRRAFIAHAPGHAVRLDLLEKRIEAALKVANARYQT